MCKYNGDLGIDFTTLTDMDYSAGPIEEVMGPKCLEMMMIYINIWFTKSTYWRLDYILITQDTEYIRWSNHLYR